MDKVAVLIPCYNEVVDYRDRPQGSVSKLNTYQDGFKVLRTMGKLFIHYKPFLFYSVVAGLLSVLSAVFVVPVVVHYIQSGLVERVPTLIVCGFAFLAALLALFSGCILSRLNTQFRQHFEMQLIRTDQAWKLTELKWRGRYSQMTLVKGLSFPFTLAVCYWTGLKLTTLFLLLWAVSCGFFLWAVAPSVSGRRWILVIVYVILLYNPVFANVWVGMRVYRNGVVISQVLMLTAMLLSLVVFAAGIAYNEISSCPTINIGYMCVAYGLASAWKLLCVVYVTDKLFCFISYAGNRFIISAA